MKLLLRGLALAGLFLFFGSTGAFAGDTRFGVGAHYWVVVDDITAKNFDEDGVSWIISLQQKLGPVLRLEGDIEILPEGFGGSPDRGYAPQAYIGVGSGFHADFGVGINYLDGDFQEKPFYALRAGIELELIPSLFIDINANYRFEDFNRIKTVDHDVSTTVVTMGAFARLEF